VKTCARSQGRSSVRFQVWQPISRRGVCNAKAQSREPEGDTSERLSGEITYGGPES